MEIEVNVKQKVQACDKCHKAKDDIMLTTVIIGGADTGFTESIIYKGYICEQCLAKGVKRMFVKQTRTPKTDDAQ